MSYLRRGRLGDQADAPGAGAAPRSRCTTPGRTRVLRLFTGSPGLTRAMHTVGAAVPGSRHGNNSEMLAALEDVVDQFSAKSAPRYGLSTARQRTGELASS